MENLQNEILPKIVILKNWKLANFRLLIMFILGDTGDGVMEWLKMVWRDNLAFPHIKLIFPTAPKRWVC